MIHRDYEALVILKSSGTEQEIARHAARLEEPIKKVGGTMAASQSMGRRKLAFRISRQTEGHFHLLKFKAPTEQIRELERLFRLNEAIVRFVILSADEIGPSGPATARSAAPTRSVTAPTRS